MYDQEKMRQLEEQILKSEIPEDELNQSAVSKITKDIKKEVKASPQKAIGIGVIATTAVISLILLCNILSIVSQKPTLPQGNSEEAEIINGFDALAAEEQSNGQQVPPQSAQMPLEGTQEGAAQESASNIESGQNKPYTEQGNLVTESPTNAETVKTEEPDLNKYFASPAIQTAFPEDSLIQIGESIYKIPVNLRELEANGINLITLGSAPPSEDVMLSPAQRDGYVQFGQERYRVKLSNGQECTYHDLQIVGINIENVKSASVYVFGGLTIGSEEASIPQQTATLIEMDFAKTHTFHYFGQLTEKTMWNTSGKRTAIITNNQTGKVDRIEVFNNSTME